MIVCDSDCPPESFTTTPGGTEIGVTATGGGSVMGVGGVEVVSGVTTDTIVERPPSFDDASATPNAAPSPMTVIAGATTQTRANQRFMALARGWTVTGLSRHLIEDVGATHHFL